MSGRNDTPTGWWLLGWAIGQALYAAVLLVYAIALVAGTWWIAALLTGLGGPELPAVLIFAGLAVMLASKLAQRRAERRTR